MEYTRGELRLVLLDWPGELKQHHMEKLTAEVVKSTLGARGSEHYGKVLRAAVIAGWVKHPALVVGKERDDVAELMPNHVRWYAEQIDALYAEASELPPE